MKNAFAWRFENTHNDFMRLIIVIESFDLKFYTDKCRQRWRVILRNLKQIFLEASKNVYSASNTLLCDKVFN